VICGSKFMPFKLTILTIAALGFARSNRDTVKCWRGQCPQVYILWHTKYASSVLWLFSARFC